MASLPSSLLCSFRQLTLENVVGNSHGVPEPAGGRSEDEVTSVDEHDGVGWGGPALRDGIAGPGEERREAFVRGVRATSGRTATGDLSETEADLEAVRWGLFAWEDPFAAPGPFWPVAPMMEVVPAPAPAGGPGLAEMVRESGASLEGLMLADGTLILKVERAGRARQVRIADGERFDPWRGTRENS